MLPPPLRRKRVTLRAKVSVGVESDAIPYILFYIFIFYFSYVLYRKKYVTFVTFDPKPLINDGDVTVTYGDAFATNLSHEPYV